MTTKRRDTEGRSAGARHPVSSDGQKSGRDAPSKESWLDQVLHHTEKHEIVLALRQAKGQRTLAARLLGISRSRLYRRMEALGIDPYETGEEQLK